MFIFQISHDVLHEYLSTFARSSRNGVNRALPVQFFSQSRSAAGPFFRGQKIYLVDHQPARLLQQFGIELLHLRFNNGHRLFGFLSGVCWLNINHMQQ